jgi:hypothetical protein
MGEFKRIFNKRMYLMMLLLIIGNLGVFTYIQFAGKSVSEMKNTNGNYNLLIERYKDMELGDAAKQSSTELSAVKKYARSLLSEEQNKNEVQQAWQDIWEEQEKQPTNKKDTQTILQELDEKSLEMVRYYETLTPLEQTDLELSMKAIVTKLGSLSKYKDSVNTVFTNAANMKRFKLFTKSNSFSYNNILRTSSDFSRVKDVELKLDNDRGVDAFLSYYNLYYIAAAVMLAVIYGLLKERENGMWEIVHNTAQGRGRLAFKRLLLIVAGSFMVHMALYCTTLITALCIYGGWSDLNHPIQTIARFSQFTYAFSKMEYVVVLFLISWGVILGLSIIVWMLFTVFRNRNHTLLCIASIVGIEILVYQRIAVQSIYNVFHYINVVSFLKINDV